MKILCVGPIWRGSNAGGLFKALSRNGALIEVVDEFYHIPLSSVIFKVKALSKIFRKLYIEDFNAEIKRAEERFLPDLILVYKGAFVLPDTLALFKAKGLKLYNFYPDVSFHTHGSLLKRNLVFFDKIFTTKTFGKKDYQEQLGIEETIFIPHGFDPEIHRVVSNDIIPKSFFCDVSFIGTYSPKKEKILNFIIEKLPHINLKIWGTQWEKTGNESLKKYIQPSGVFGDLYAAAIQASKINLGILSEKVKGASSGDLITSRTFHIPASGGFLLHEKNSESVTYFEEGEEAAFYVDEIDLVQKIEFYLTNTNERNRVIENGLRRAQQDHSLDDRAKRVLHHIQ